MAVATVPVVLGTMGFTGAGIAASSLAAKMMSVAAIANGGGVAAGSLVATLQSVGECPWGAEKGRSLRGAGPDPCPSDLSSLFASVPTSMPSLWVSLWEM